MLLFIVLLVIHLIQSGFSNNVEDLSHTWVSPQFMFWIGEATGQNSSSNTCQHLRVPLNPTDWSISNLFPVLHTPWTCGVPCINICCKCVLYCSTLFLKPRWSYGAPCTCSSVSGAFTVNTCVLLATYSTIWHKHKRLSPWSLPGLIQEHQHHQESV